jgi:hypothetical protein
VVPADVDLHLAVARAPDEPGGVGPHHLAQPGDELPGPHVPVLRREARVDERLHQQHVAVAPAQCQVGAVRERCGHGHHAQQDPPERARLEQHHAQHADGAGSGDHQGRGHERHRQVVPAEGPDLDPDDEQQQRRHEDVDHGEAQVHGCRPLGGEHGRRLEQHVRQGRHEDGVQQARREGVAGPAGHAALHQAGERGRHEPGGDDPQRRQVQQPDHQRHTGQGEAVRPLAHLDHALAELARQQGRRQDGGGRGERGARRSGQQRGAVPGQHDGAEGGHGEEREGQPRGGRDAVGEQPWGPRPRQACGPAERAPPSCTWWLHVKVSTGPGGG